MLDAAGAEEERLKIGLEDRSDINDVDHDRWYG